MNTGTNSVGMLPTDKDVRLFWRRGWMIQRSLFTEGEFLEIRAQVLESLKDAESGRKPPTDLLADARLARLVAEPRLISLARAILKDDPVYFGDASYAVVGRGYDEHKDATGYHRDNTDRSHLEAPDWNGRYPLIRFGLYLQDHRRRSGGLMVRQASHRRLLKGWRCYLYDRYLDTGLGDVGVWNMRLQHAGVGRFYRGFPRLAIAPAIQDRVPRWLQSPRWDQPRAAVWISYGADSDHLQRHVEYLFGRAERVRMWQHSYYSQETLDACRRNGLRVIDVGEQLRGRIAAGKPVGQHEHHYQLAF